MRPILKWAGGKARLAPQICAAFKESCSGRYYEPFVGSAAVYLHRRVNGMVGRAVLSDANPKLINVHRMVRSHLDALLRELDRLPKDDWRERYYDVREDFNRYALEEGPVQAARFLWLNRAGFNGLYRENRKGFFNVPVGRYTKLSFPKEEHFRTVSELMQDAQLRVADFRDVMNGADEGDQIYCDPPYIPLTATASFTGYCSSPFGIAEQKALGRAALKASFKGARVVLSNHDHPTVRNELYPSSDGFRYVARPRVARAISRKALGRKGVNEVIAVIDPRKIA